jgi:predicted DNA-binding ribbon-helix-helix protein
MPFTYQETVWRINGGMVLMTRRSHCRSPKVLACPSTSGSVFVKMACPNTVPIYYNVYKHTVSIHGQITVLRIGFISPSRRPCHWNVTSSIRSSCVHGLKSVNVQDKPQEVRVSDRTKFFENAKLRIPHRLNDQSLTSNFILIIELLLGTIH